MIRSFPWPIAALLAVASLLAGCDALLGGGKPAQLYRFGASSPPAPMAAGGVLPVATRTVLLLPVRFAAEIDGDRILTVQGQTTQYIKGVRWVASAPTLFAAALTQGFAARTPGIAVIDRRAGRPADAALQIDVDRFEARYAGTVGTPPVVALEGRATLIDITTHRPIGTYRLAAGQAATATNAPAITAAFDQVAATIVAATVDWANATIPVKAVAAVPLDRAGPSGQPPTPGPAL